MKIFWSWQADTPGKTGRFFIRDALQLAIDRLKQDPQIDEPNREALHLDPDRQGVPGSPDLVQAILDKIEGAELVVADVTPVGIVTAGQDAGRPKKLINSNVATELGYAWRTQTSSKVLMVFNSHYGTHEDLPFDIRQRGGAIVYQLAPGADRASLRAEHRKLVSLLYDALKLCTGDNQQPAADPCIELPTTFARAAYFQRGETLATLGESDSERQEFFYDSPSLAYLRLLPTTPRPAPLRLAELIRCADRAPVLSPQRGQRVSDLNEYGAIGFEPRLYGQPPRTRIEASTQFTQSGELWAVSANLVILDRGARPASVRVPFITARQFEETYTRLLRELVAFAKANLELLPPWQVELGVVGLKGVSLGLSDQEFHGPIRQDEVWLRESLGTDQQADMNAVLLKFFEALHDASGYSRPDRFANFPP